MVNKLLFTLLVLSLTMFTNTYAQKSETVQELVIEFLDTVEHKAYMTSMIDWDSARPAFIEETKHITEIKELLPHFQKFLKQLKDYHSGMFYGEGDDEKDENALLRAYATLTLEELGYPPLNFKHELINDKYAYINIPGVTLERRKYIETIGQQMQELDEKNPKAWIFDITENEGGTLVPMLWPVYHLIDHEDEYYSFVDNKGEAEMGDREMWDLTDAEEDDIKMFELSRLNDESLIPTGPVHRDIPIVVLTSNKTGSSAEFFAAAFKGQRNATLIGQKTVGLTSGNEAYFMGNNYVLNLTTVVLQDRSGKVYKIAEGIDPDISVEIEGNLSAEDYEKPEVKQKFLDAAIKFLDEL